ncbi:MAG: hypothetical protein KGZ92_07270 [Firmicutes bacterium]|nr:hypothetical protein [Dethiobacter sp.]MBS3889074.1 hypothetical protein [Bacillota bacterium]
MPIPLIIAFIVPFAFWAMVEDYIQYKKGIGTLVKVKILGGLILGFHFILIVSIAMWFSGAR